MKPKVVVAPEAEDQLLALYRYIAAQASPETASEYVSAILDRCDSLAHFPERGTPRDEIRPGLRTIPFRRRVTIAYRVLDEEVAILGIFYGGRDIGAFFDEE
ncbi:MAG TPA: type II toxin-antitoxin system RelE/ParE family toxin [Allosphingosinicella sp.]|jgi:toxin ParE1/3/4|nr:type II toxin-antitoxin system RelE/ParE family toxin [Allosphingosinicella sp.]